MPERLTPHLARYSWGHSDLVHAWLGTPPDGPVAEAWYGTHPAGPTMLADGSRSLAELIADGRELAVGPGRGDGTNGLPWLVKLLAAARPLSLQTHPGSATARRRYDEGHRSYSDPNGKPEALIALVDTWALLGFEDPRTASVRAADLGAHRLASLLADGTAAAARTLWTNPELAAALSQEISRQHRDSSGTGPFAGVLEHFAGDPSLAVAFCMRPVHLPAGTGVELPPGMLHAYLSGGGLEVMGSSDNVLRGGLTEKHVDVEELLAVLDPEAEPALFDATGGGTLPLRTLPCRVMRHRTDPVGDATTLHGPAVVWVDRGVVEATNACGVHEMTAGTATFFLHDDGPVRLSGGSAWVIADRQGNGDADPPAPTVRT